MPYHLDHLAREVLATTERGSVVVRLEGPAVAQGRIALDDLALVAGRLQQAVRRIALVLRGEQGTKPGRRPKEVEDLTRLEVLALRSGSLVLELDLAEQERPFEGMDIGRAAVERLVAGLGALGRNAAVPEGWDPGVLVAAKEMGAVFARGVERIDVEVSVDGVPLHGRLEPKTVEVIRRLMREPVRNLQMVEGRLLMADFRETATRCRVHPATSPPVECTFDEAHRQAVLDALTRYVRVSGEALMDEATGRIRLLRIADLEVLDVVPASGEGPYPFWEPLGLDELARLQGVAPVEDPESLRAPIWESDEELERFLEEVYRARGSETV